VCLAISSLVFLEIAQVRRWLILGGRHQKAITTQKVDFFADADVSIPFATHCMAEPSGFVGSHTPIRLVHHPWPRESMVDGGDVVVQ